MNIPVDHPFRVHIAQRVDDLRRIIADTFDRKRAHSRYSSLQLAVSRQVQHEDYQAQGKRRAARARGVAGQTLKYRGRG